LFANELKYAVVSDKTNLVISAIGIMRNNKLALDLDLFIKQMEKRLINVEDTPENSIKYSSLRHTLALAKQIKDRIMIR
jgi:hypothetical protein